MTSYQTPTTQLYLSAQRREGVSLPSRRKHIIIAAVTFCTIAAIPFLSINLFGNPKDALSFGVVDVEPIEEIAALAPLDDEALTTPDILAGELSAGENPTENGSGNSPSSSGPKLDALGNPIAGSGDTLLAITQTPTPQVPSVTTLGSGSKTILIDGNAIGPSRLAPAPFSGLTRSNQYGNAPTKGPNGRTPLNSYNRPFSDNSGKKPVSIIIGGLGVNRSVTQQAIDSLPPDITLSFAAHITGLQDWINRAREAGHEVMIEIPMDSVGFDASEAGADKALRTSHPAPENLRNMDWLLSRGQGYFGVINYNGDSFLTRADVSAPILGKLSDSGLGFITDGAFSAPSLAALSRSVNLPYKNSFGLIDPEANTQIIRGQLDSLSSSAISGTQPIGVGFAYPETIDTVVRWVSDLDKQNLILAPASHSLVK